MRHAVIMAGGSGTRLWPLSRKNRPKQLLRLFDGKSLLQLARQRLDGLFEPQNIWVITSAAYIDQVAEELPDIPRENLIGEPVGRDTANAIGLSAHLLHRCDDDATMAVFTADHLIEPVDRFQDAIRRGLEAAETHRDSLVTFGITPAEPHTGYGYIHRGQPISPGVYRVLEFKEKPSREIAEQYVRSGEYYWNSGMFCWHCPTILRELETHLPHNHGHLAKLAERWEHICDSDECREVFEQLEKISIDFAVMEKADSVLVVEMDCRWRDVGSWPSLAAVLAADEAGNVSAARRSLIVEGRGNIVVSEQDEHLIVVLGAADLIVVHSPDATLVCPRDRAEQIKTLAALRQQRYGDRYE